MKMQKEDVDKIVRTIQDIPPVFEDIGKAAADGDGISLAEGGVLVIKHGGKALRFLSAIREIGRELADCDPEEAEIIIDEIGKTVGGDNELAIDGAKDIAAGSVRIKNGVVKILESRKQES